ncbi:ribosomal protein uS13 [endosymbiont GvMRE of Glomus versiforme]|uniref:ribosomal protein uS13 n=1 Tax=endosymbiont GvMRE of Glomus versiforme TaxID=2039283 RepID=UPI000EBF029F|nr:30S ribosomal protein S13 [endosymbiont GvMRE of Glomus versiforme]RHZ37564.1 30S ribosomal protein S13 [endosymbiont GvMRE of Glomus versiforme]
MAQIVRIGNVSVPAQKNVYVALSTIYGIGKKFKKKSRARQVLEKLKIDPLAKTKDLTDEQINLINHEVQQFEIEGDLKQIKKQNIEEKIRINCLQGRLHSMGKKVRGQPTRHNNRTRPSGIISFTKQRVAVTGKKKAPKQG